MLDFDLRGIDVAFRGMRQDSPPKMTQIEFEIVVDTNETDSRIELLHRTRNK